MPSLFPLFAASCSFLTSSAHQRTLRSQEVFTPFFSQVGGRPDSFPFPISSQIVLYFRSVVPQVSPYLQKAIDRVLSSSSPTFPSLIFYTSCSVHGETTRTFFVFPFPFFIGHQMSPPVGHLLFFFPPLFFFSFFYIVSQPAHFYPHSFSVYYRVLSEFLSFYRSYFPVHKSVSGPWAPPPHAPFFSPSFFAIPPFDKRRAPPRWHGTRSFPPPPFSQQKIRLASRCALFFARTLLPLVLGFFFSFLFL